MQILSKFNTSLLKTKRYMYQYYVFKEYQCAVHGVMHFDTYFLKIIFVLLSFNIELKLST